MDSTLEALLAQTSQMAKRLENLEALKLRSDICEIIQHDPKDTSDSAILSLIREYEEFTNMNMDEWDVVQMGAHKQKRDEDEIARLNAENEKLKKDLSSHYDFSQRVIDACKIREDLESQDDDSIIQGIYNVMRMYAVHCPIWMRE